MMNKVKDIFEVSLCCKAVSGFLDNGYYNWKKRIEDDFHVVPSRKNWDEYGYLDYIRQYQFWHSRQEDRFQAVNREVALHQMLVGLYAYIF